MKENTNVLSAIYVKLIVNIKHEKIVYHIKKTLTSKVFKFKCFFNLITFEHKSRFNAMIYHFNSGLNLNEPNI